MNRPRVDLASDTKTRPTAAMRHAMLQAEVGDEQAFEDPTVNALCERVAALLGKEAAVFLPSGTMANAIAYRLHCRPGDAILCDRTAHGIDSEAGAPAALGGAMIIGLNGERGVFTAAQLEAAIGAPTRHDPRRRLVVVENTSNMGGGTVWRPAAIASVAEVARAHRMALHLDGARLMNAAVASGTSAAAFCAPFDSCWIDFSKGLGAPVGAALAGSRDFVDEAWRVKQQLGGAMRQAGVLAAACLWALDHHVDRLAEDHANAAALAAGLAAVPGIALNPLTVETNLVFFDLEAGAVTAAGFCALLLERGVRMGAMSDTRVRAVTHLDVDRGGIERAIAAATDVLGQPQSSSSSPSAATTRRTTW